MQEVQNVKINEAVSLKDDSQNKKYDFSKYSDLEGFYLDDELLAKFQPIAQELNLSQESVELLLDIAYQMSLKQDEKFKKDLDERQNSLIEEYDQMFINDIEIPDKNSLKIRDYMSVADVAYNFFATPKLKETLTTTGMIYHPELIKMFHKIGELMQEDNISYSNKPAVEELTPAQILYGKRD